MQGVAQPILDRAGALLPMAGVGQPFGAMGDIGPGADMGEPADQRVDVAIDLLQPADLIGHPIDRQAAAPGQMAEHRVEQLEVRLGQGLAEIRDLADRPEQPDAGRAGGALAHLRPPGQHLQADMVERVAGLAQTGEGRRRVEAGLQTLQAVQVKVAIAPAQLAQRREIVAFQRLDHAGIEAADIDRRAEGAVAQMPPGAAGDLADLGHRQPAPFLAVELLDAGQRHMGDVHVEAHADRVRGDQMIDLAGLVERHLGIAGARAEGAEHDRRPAAMTADQLGQRIDVLGGERHHRAAPRQPGDLGGLGIGQGREARPRDHLDLGHQHLEQRPDGVGAQEHGLVDAAGVQQTVGEDVAALAIGAELDLVDREEADRPIERHRLDRGNHVARVRRQDLLFAGDQGGRPSTLGDHDPIIDLTRQEAERTADHAGGVGQHAFDREVRLARIGRTENG